MPVKKLGWAVRSVGEKGAEVCGDAGLVAGPSAALLAEARAASLRMTGL